jgi:hypothetical protein
MFRLKDQIFGISRSCAVSSHDRTPTRGSSRAAADAKNLVSGLTPKPKLTHRQFRALLRLITNEI